MDNKEKNFASAVIYVHNCENRIEAFLDTIIIFLEERFEHSEIICVNDCSDDASVDVIRKVSEHASLTSISVITMSYYHGLELAMNAGMDLAIGDYVFEFDNTRLDFDPSVIWNVYTHSLEGYDIVSASPDRTERFSSRIFYMVFDRFTELSYQMCTESFRILSRRVINRVSGMNRTIPYRKAIYANSGLKTDNLKYQPISVFDSQEDRKEKKFRRELAGDSLIMFTDTGYVFAKAMTLLMMFISIIMMIYTVVIYLLSSPVAGWTTTVFFLSVAFFGIFALMTIIIKYLQVLVNLVFKRKQYSFESIEKITK